MANMTKFGVLVVDDEEFIIKSMRRTLRREGFESIISALSAEQGIKLLENTQNQFFLIISDQRMPGMNGSEFLEKSILLSPESRRMLVTGYSDLDDAIDAVNKGEIHQYISKPWDEEDLILRIREEQDIFMGRHERKRLFKKTQRQNAKLFYFAENLRKTVLKYTSHLKLKQEEAALLSQAIQDAKEQAEFKEVFLGLEELLARTITIDKRNLDDAFNICVDESIDVFKNIAQENKMPFSNPGSSNRISIEDLGDDMFEIIDPAIENIVQAVESRLFGIGAEPMTGVTIDDYKEIPGFGALAFNDGYITKGEFKQGAEILEEKESELSTGLTIDKVLLDAGFLRRRDLSRIYAKISLIEARLLDRQFAQMLLDREVVTKKDIDRAFRKQLNNFEDSGVTRLLGDILVESDVIASDLKDEVMATQDRTRAGQQDMSNAGEFSSEFGAVVDLQVSGDRTQAWIRVPEAIHGTENVKPIKDLIKKRGIKYGIVKDVNIRKFIKDCTDPSEKFIVAMGVPASAGNPAQLIYHFNTEAESAGQIREDGSIDFTSRGKSAFIKRGETLAEKIPMQDPKPGKDIFDQLIEVGEVEDATLTFGDGAELSEDGLKLTALVTGQPVLNIKGEVSVLEQFTVFGNVDLKSGNIQFNGNVLVKGAVTEGFSVECAELICEEINGGNVTATGDVKVSNGIVNATIEAEGSIQTKFVNRSKLFAFKDVMVTREIMASRIFTSGRLDNTTGRITSSNIAFRQESTVKQIGTIKSEGAKIRIGTDDHINWFCTRFDSRIETFKVSMKKIIKEKLIHTDDFNSLHADVANQTFAQDKINKKIEATEKKIGKASSPNEKKDLVKELKELEIRIQDANERIDNIFKKQDETQTDIDRCETEIKTITDQINDLEGQKKKYTDNVRNEDPTPMLVITSKAFRDTKLFGNESVKVLKDDFGASKFLIIFPKESDASERIEHLNL